MQTSSCPCGSGQKYEGCCEPFISGKAPAPTAEALMRARYSAYVKHEIDFVGRTHDPKGANDFDPVAARQWAETAEWQGLEIRNASDDGHEGTVEFVARFKVEGQDQAHHELSWFRKDDESGQWYYVDGKTVKSPLVRAAPKIGRNEPCACGSGKKSKKCCAA